LHAFSQLGYSTKLFGLRSVFGLRSGGATAAAYAGVEVHLTPKYFFRLNKSLHPFETYCAFLALFNPNIDFLEAVKVTKSGHHLSHDRASKGHGSILDLMSQTDLHHIMSL